MAVAINLMQDIKEVRDIVLENGVGYLKKNLSVNHIKKAQNMVEFYRPTCAADDLVKQA